MDNEDDETYGSEAWDDLRARFSNAELKDIELSQLAKNVGLSWPFRGEQETAARYLDLDLEALQQVPGLIGKKRRIRTLMDILRETLAFDDPFAEMIGVVEAGEGCVGACEKSLLAYGIPNNYPAACTPQDAQTAEWVRANGIDELGRFVALGELRVQEGEASPELRECINALAQGSEPAIARYLPIRSGCQGLHLPEAVGLLVRVMDPAVRAKLQQVGEAVTGAAGKRAAAEAGAGIEADLEPAFEKIHLLLSWFGTAFHELKAAFDPEGSPARYFITLNDPGLEQQAIGFCRLYLASLKADQTGLIDRLGGLFGRGR